MTDATRELVVRRPRRRAAHNRRQLALVAWMATHLPPGTTSGEKIEMTKLLTRWLDESEERQVAAMVEQGAAEIEKVLRRSRSQLFRAGGRRRG